MRAGLLAAVQADVLPGSAGWHRIVLRPGAHAMRELTREALRATGAPGGSIGDLLEHLVRDDGTAYQPRLLVCVDQCEEVWTTCADPEERRAFLDALAAGAGVEPGLLPLLSTALTRLWEARHGRRFTLAARRLRRT